MITVSGVWAELMLCSLATPIWWGTSPGTALHDFAYTIILLTGFAVVLINWNPLIKLDGYYIVSDLLGVADLKEASTLYFSSWVTEHLGPSGRGAESVQAPPTGCRCIRNPFRSLQLFGFYIFASFVGNIARNFSADWGFLFEYGTAFIDLSRPASYPLELYEICLPG